MGQSSRSFGLRCGACEEAFDYDNEDEWTAHVRKAHVRNPPRSISPVRQPAKPCVYCDKNDVKGHVTEHSGVAFRCKTCPESKSDSNYFADFSEIRRHYSTEHGVRDVESKVRIFMSLELGLGGKFRSSPHRQRLILLLHDFFNGPFPASFRLFLSFRTVQLLKNLAASGIRTRIIGTVDENADHYTTTTAHSSLSLTLAFEVGPDLVFWFQALCLVLVRSVVWLK